MRSVRKLPAKALKRVGQLRRLGARGLAYTAYVRTLGPTVYRLADPARKSEAARHARRCLEPADPSRIERLKERCEREIPSPPGPGERIEFGTDHARFMLTLEAMLDLAAAGCAVPRVTGVDWNSNTIVRESVTGLQPPLDHKRTALEKALAAIHQAGWVLGEVGEDSITYAEGGVPIVIGLQRAIPLAGLSSDVAVHLRDADREAFNRLFGTALMTADRLREFTASLHGSAEDIAVAQSYAPVVIRDDIHWGKIWNTDVGIGRWNFIMKDNLPIPIGGSVLDLGANNGFNPLQMLRAGAASAVGVEIDKPAIERGLLLKSAFEWLDNRSYDFRYIHGSQADLRSFDLPRFDVVTAFCSLYYLPADEVRDLVRYIRTMTSVLVVQCNTDRLIDRGGDEETFRKASVEFAVAMLDQAGFTDRRIVAPPGYSRPLVIGRAQT